MSVQFLSSSQAFKSGADLWVLNDSKYNEWTARIDWHLRFQIRKQKLKTLQPLSLHTQALLKKYNIPDFQWKPPAPLPLLMESSFYLPNLWTIEIAYTDEWLNRIYDIWHSLNRPSLRIFAPQSMTKGKIEQKWQRAAQNTPVQCIISN